MCDQLWVSVWFYGGGGVCVCLGGCLCHSIRPSVFVSVTVYMSTYDSTTCVSLSKGVSDNVCPSECVWTLDPQVYRMREEGDQTESDGQT